MSDLKQSAGKLIQNTAQGAKEIQTMYVSLEPQMAHRGPNVLVKEFQRKTMQGVTEKQYLRRDVLSRSGGRPES